MDSDILFYLSFLGIAFHLYLENKYFATWAEGREMFPNTGYFEKKPLMVSCISITVIYGAVVFSKIYIDNDLTKALIIGAQGAIFFNFLVHFFLKFVWKKNMPCFWSSFFFGFLSCVLVVQFAYLSSWFSIFLIVQIFLYGMLADAILALLSLMVASILFSNTTKPKLNNWEKF